MMRSFNIRPKLVIFFILNINYTTALIITFGMKGLHPRPRVCGVAVHCMHLTIIFTLKNPKYVMNFQVTLLKA